MSRLRVVVVGAGRSGLELRARHFQQLDRTQVVGFCDPDLEAAARAAQEIGADGAHASLGEALAAGRPDIVAICSPPRFHFEQARQALAAGCHVLLEKPMVVSLSELMQLGELQTEAEGRLTVVHNQKLEPRFVELARRVRDGEIGEPIHVERVWIGSGRDDRMLAEDDYWAHDLPGGRWGETLPHDLYLAYQFLGEMSLVRLLALDTHRRWPRLPCDELHATLTNGRATCSLRLSVAATRPYSQMLVCGTAGALRLAPGGIDRLPPPRKRNPLAAWLKSSRTLASFGVRRVGGRLRRLRRRAGDGARPARRSSHYRMVELFVAYVTGKGPQPVTWEEAESTMRLTLEIADGLDAHRRRDDPAAAEAVAD